MDEPRTIEGWLCRSTDMLPAPDNDQQPFEKAYCVLDYTKTELLLCDKTNGTVVDRLFMKNRLVHVETTI